MRILMELNDARISNIQQGISNVQVKRGQKKEIRVQEIFGILNSGF
jgi:hypothetical protein